MNSSITSSPVDSIPEYPILYKIKSKGKINKWQIKIEQENDLPNIIYKIIVIFGEIDGKQQIHTTNIEKGKSNRSVFQQSILEANSKWNEKKNRDGYDENIPINTVIDSVTTVSNSTAKINNSFSNHSIFSPMLANTFNFKLYESLNRSSTRSFKISFPAFVQKKYDGIRCIAYLDPSKNIVLQSRKNMRFSHFSNIEYGLKIFFEKVGIYLRNNTRKKYVSEIEPPRNFYFDGELYSNSIPFETLNGYVRLTKNITPRDKENIDKIHYHIYDCFNGEIPNATYKERNMLLKTIFESVKNEDDTQEILKQIHQVETEEVNNIEDIKIKHAQYVENGFEGIMIRESNGIYEPNKRSKYLQKYKEFMEDEFEIVGFHDGEGVDRELVIWDCVTKEGNKFSVRPRTTFEERKRLFKEADKYLGKKLTVIFQEYSPDKIPRFPVGKAIREDI